MNKTLLVVAIALLLVLAPVDAKRRNKKFHVPKAKSPASIVQAPVSLKHSATLSPEWCATCVNFMGQAVNEILNIIANVGVIGGCAKVCSYLPNQLEATICDLLCSAVGIDAFVHLVEDADPDPIWICQSLRVCPSSTNGSAVINSFTVTPASGPAETVFHFAVEYNITGDIGTGEIAFTCNTVDGNQLGTGSILVQPALGVYSVDIRLDTKPNQNEGWLPGVYLNEFDVCSGGCGSKHEWAKLLASAFTNFTITDHSAIRRRH